MGEKGLSRANEPSSIPATAAAPVATNADAAIGRAMTESVSGRFEEAARKAQERINQRSQEKSKRTIAGDDVTET